MLASELARELEIDPSVMSKRLSVYFAESGRKAMRYLDDETIDSQRQVHLLLKERTATSTKQAIRTVLGMTNDSLSPSIAQSIDQRMTEIEKVAVELKEMAKQIMTEMKKQTEEQILLTEVFLKLEQNVQSIRSALDSEFTPSESGSQVQI